MRGENAQRLHGQCHRIGTPPHAWGKLTYAFIPCATRTGTPPHAWGKLNTIYFHPRAEGTPPHAWGKHRFRPGRVVDRRYTPTCVGKTELETVRFRLDRVHPHMRGENCDSARPQFRQHGTPPHAWGKRLASESGRVFQPVHPHMRGENTRGKVGGVHYGGTPPHAWGKLSSLSGTVSGFRYTPTCVGKTCAAMRLSTFTPVHPHMRGEN